MGHLSVHIKIEYKLPQFVKKLFKKSQIIFDSINIKNVHYYSVFKSSELSIAQESPMPNKINYFLFLLRTQKLIYLTYITYRLTIFIWKQAKCVIIYCFNYCICIYSIIIIAKYINLLDYWSGENRWLHGNIFNGV